MMALSARSLMFQSVFPSSIGADAAPTPQATPYLTQESFDHTPAYDPGSAAATSFSDTASEAVRWERAWHTATSFLTDQLHGKAGSKAYNPQVQAAIEYLRSPDSIGWKLRKSNKADDLFWWYSQAFQEECLQKHAQVLLKLCGCLDSRLESWSELRRRMERTKALLTGPFHEYVLPALGRSGRACTKLLQESYGALIRQLVIDLIWQPFQDFVKANTTDILYLHDSVQYDAERSMEGLESTAQNSSGQGILELISDLIGGGLPADSLETLVANSLVFILKDHVAQSCARRWESPSSTVQELKSWVSGPLATFASDCLTTIRGSKVERAELTSIDVATLQKTALRELGLLRLQELFDIVVDWDNGSRGGIEDLKSYISTQQGRQQVVSNFNEVLSYRLLHPGASTDQILEIYIKVMKAFAVLDQRFVILDRVSRPIRRYLRERDDTVRIIIAGLLSDPDNPETTPDALGELAVELHNLDEVADTRENDDWDWDDMNWQPNPADAEADYKSAKGLDVIGNLLSLFEAKDTVVREFQNILGERLLSPESDFPREIRVLELLKSRFGDGPLQGCEVMIKDIFDSGRTEALIKKEQGINQGAESAAAVATTTGGQERHTEVQPDFHSKVLSRFFWPPLRDDEFRVPAGVAALRDRFAAGFERHKTQRKLAWLPALGQVTVELRLADRIVTEAVTPWQASVIYAFDGGDDGEDTSASPDRTAAQLADQLSMDADLVANALTFWVSRLVLFEPAPGVYRVLETRPPAVVEAEGDGSGGGCIESGNVGKSNGSNDKSDAAPGPAASADIVAAAHSASAAAAASAASAVRSDDELLERRMHVVWQYVVGMLTNQGPMPLRQMLVMLNFVVPGGFQHSPDELRAYLQRKVDEGELAMAGAAYRMPKA